MKNMKKMIAPLNNEEGSAIVIALMVLVMLTMIGIVSTDNTVVELQIVRNEALLRDNFYRSESAALELARWMEDNNISNPAAINWITPQAAAPDMEVVSNWDWSGGGSQNARLSPNLDVAADVNNNTAYAAVDKGRARRGGGGLGLDEASSLYSYSVYGLFDSTTGQGQSLIMMEYRKRF